MTDDAELRARIEAQVAARRAGASAPRPGDRDPSAAEPQESGADPVDAPIEDDAPAAGVELPAAPGSGPAGLAPKRPWAQRDSAKDKPARAKAPAVRKPGGRKGAVDPARPWLRPGGDATGRPDRDDAGQVPDPEISDGADAPASFPEPEPSSGSRSRRGAAGDSGPARPWARRRKSAEEAPRAARAVPTPSNPDVVLRGLSAEADRAAALDPAASPARPPRRRPVSPPSVEQTAALEQERREQELAEREAQLRAAEAERHAAARRAAEELAAQAARREQELAEREAQLQAAEEARLEALRLESERIEAEAAERERELAEREARLQAAEEARREAARVKAEELAARAAERERALAEREAQLQAAAEREAAERALDVARLEQELAEREARLQAAEERPATVEASAADGPAAVGPERRHRFGRRPAAAEPVRADEAAVDERAVEPVAADDTSLVESAGEEAVPAAAQTMSSEPAEASEPAAYVPDDEAMVAYAVAAQSVLAEPPTEDGDDDETTATRRSRRRRSRPAYPKHAAVPPPAEVETFESDDVEPAVLEPAGAVADDLGPEPAEVDGAAAEAEEYPWLRNEEVDLDLHGAPTWDPGMYPPEAGGTEKQRGKRALRWLFARADEPAMDEVAAEPSAAPAEPVAAAAEPESAPAMFVPEPEPEPEPEPAAAAFAPESIQPEAVVAEPELPVRHPVGADDWEYGSQIDLDLELPGELAAAPAADEADRAAAAAEPEPGADPAAGRPRARGDRPRLFGRRRRPPLEDPDEVAEEFELPDPDAAFEQPWLRSAPAPQPTRDWSRPAARPEEPTPFFDGDAAEPEPAVEPDPAVEPEFALAAIPAPLEPVAEPEPEPAPAAQAEPEPAAQAEPEPAAQAELQPEPERPPVSATRRPSPGTAAPRRRPSTGIRPSPGATVGQPAGRRRPAPGAPAAAATPATVRLPAQSAPVRRPGPGVHARPAPPPTRARPGPGGVVARPGISGASDDDPDPAAPPRRRGPFELSGVAGATPPPRTRTGTGTTIGPNYQPDLSRFLESSETEPEDEPERDDENDDDENNKNKKGGGSSRWRRLFMRGFIVAFIAVVAALLLRLFVVQPYYIPSASMEPTLHGCPGCNDDHVLVDKISYRAHDVRADDIVVFDRPKGVTVPEKVLIKRVIALPGDKISLKKGQVFVNGLAKVEPYLNKDHTCYAGSPDETFAARTVPSGDVFVMGDNRCDSTDSRSFGAIPTSSIVGRAFAIIWPFHRIRFL